MIFHSVTMINLLYTVIIWSGMHYATPQWMEKQVPDWMFDKYEVIIIPYGTSLSKLSNSFDPRTTALVGFSAGGIDVLKNYSTEYAFVGLIDPSTSSKYVSTQFGPNTVMIHDPSNWGNSNKTMVQVANQVNKTGGRAIQLDMGHSKMPKYFFETYFTRQ